jgi:hypothetical protein
MKHRMAVTFACLSCLALARAGSAAAVDIRVYALLSTYDYATNTMGYRVTVSAQGSLGVGLIQLITDPGFTSYTPEPLNGGIDRGYSGLLPDASLIVSGTGVLSIVNVANVSLTQGPTVDFGVSLGTLHGFALQYPQISATTGSPFYDDEFGIGVFDLNYQRIADVTAYVVPLDSPLPPPIPEPSSLAASGLSLASLAAGRGLRARAASRSKLTCASPRAPVVAPCSAG